MKMILAAAFLIGAAAPAFAADPMPTKPKMMHPTHVMHAAKHTTMLKPARDATTDKLNQQQLDMHKS